ncbi:MAG: tryptophan--tRNA ligase, partial [Nanoarchaeota archaeon]|nr:tryptophan--tRNA ligase [Nanoarchaeota archaeon]
KVVADMIIYLQRLGAECYIAAADIEATLTRGIKREEAKKIAIEEYLLNYIALGLKSEKTMFYFQSNGSVEYNNLSKYVSKKTTFNELKSIYGELTPEKITSAFTQVADILHPQLKENGGPKPVVVPVGLDQLPHINLTRDIASRMKSEYNFVLPSAIFNKMLPGLQGGKMSSSIPESNIALTDDPEDVKRKVMKYAFSGGRETVKEHREKGGNPDIDVSYQWLTYFEEDDKKLERIYHDYKCGNMLTGELKQILIAKLTKFLKHHQAEREKARKKVDKFLLKA